MLSRRGFFVIGGAAATISLLHNGPVLGAAAEEDRYFTAINEANAVVSAAQRFEAHDFDGPAMGHWVERVNGLILRTMAAFPENPDHASLIDLFQGRQKIVGLDEGVLRELTPGLVPIAIVRQMVLMKAPLGMTRNREAFLPFADRYRHLLAA